MVSVSRSIFLLSFHVTTAISRDNCQEVSDVVSEEDLTVGRLWFVALTLTASLKLFELKRNEKLSSDASSQTTLQPIS